MKSKIIFRTLIIFLSLTFLVPITKTLQFSKEPKPATTHSLFLNKGSSGLFDDDDFIDAQRGLIEGTAPPVIKNTKGDTIWDMTRFSFIKGDAPSTVNPILWRQAKLNSFAGLFKVSDHIYQIRGYDVSNMSIVEGDDGIIIIDPLTTVECAKAGIETYYKNRPSKPIVAVIYTHSHVDHFGGVEGIVSKEEVESKKIKIIAPMNLMDYALNENLYCGNAMGRRSTYMFGPYLSANAQGLVDNGIGRTLTKDGTLSIIRPTDIIEKTGQKMTISGVEMEFQYVPSTEAPTEMNIYFPKWQMLDISENTAKTLHNILTLRGAQVRDSLAWAKSIYEAIDLYGKDLEILFCQHNWPTWGHAKVVQQLKDQGDMYKYIHDQTVYLLNQGYKGPEIAEKITIPESLANKWYNKEHYGNVKTNVKAVYQKYMGWFDGNPVNLDPLPPKMASQKYLDYMGGNVKEIIRKALDDYNRGEYKWVAQLMNHVVTVDPTNEDAKRLEADALEQLGYQAATGPWRNEYLMAAHELRNGVPDIVYQDSSLIESLTLVQLLDTMGTHLSARKSKEKDITLNWILTDIQETYVVTMKNSVLAYKKESACQTADASVILSKDTIFKILTKKINPVDADITITGKKEKVLEFLSCFEMFNPKFNIITPVDS